VRSRPALIVAVAVAAGLVPSVAVGTSEPPGGASLRFLRNGFPSSFAANGFNGQSIVVVPELDLVVVVLANEAGARPDLVGARVVQAFGDAMIAE